MSPAGEADRWDIRAVLDWTVKRFERAGLDSPRLTAELLIAKALGRERLYLYTHFDQPLSPEERDGVKVLLRQRLAGTPTQYVLGSQEFWSLSLTVDHRVLIPRPETECIV